MGSEHTGGLQYCGAGGGRYGMLPWDCVVCSCKRRGGGRGGEPSKGEVDLSVGTFAWHRPLFSRVRYRAARSNPHVGHSWPPFVLLLVAAALLRPQGAGQRGLVCHVHSG